jgi:hypothetical protein
MDLIQWTVRGREFRAGNSSEWSDKMPERKFTEVKSSFVNLTIPGEQAEGTYIRQETASFREGDAPKYILQGDDGAFLSVLGSTSLVELMATVEPGTYVRITFVGTTPTRTGRPLKDFKVEIGG